MDESLSVTRIIMDREPHREGQINIDLDPGF